MHVHSEIRDEQRSIVLKWKWNKKKEKKKKSYDMYTWRLNKEFNLFECWNEEYENNVITKKMKIKKMKYLPIAHCAFWIEKLREILWLFSIWFCVLLSYQYLICHSFFFYFIFFSIIWWFRHQMVNFILLK